MADRAARGRAALGVLIVAALVYAAALSVPFVYEDFNWLDRPHASWSVPGRGVTMATHALIGLHPTLAHGLNVALHLGNGLLVYAVVTRLVPGAALLSMVVFLLHPLTSSAVAYATGRADLLMTMGVLLGVLCAVRSGRWLDAFWPALAMAAVSKEIGAIGPVLVALTLLAWRLAWPRVLTAGCLVGTGLVIGNAYTVIGNWWELPAKFGGAGLDWPSYLLTQNAALWHLLALVVWPVGFSIDHDMLAIPPSQQFLAVLLTAQALVVAGCLWRSMPVVTWSVLWVAVSVAPRFVFRTSEFLTEPQMYLPMVGVSVLVATGLSALWAPALQERTA